MYAESKPKIPLGTGLEPTTVPAYLKEWKNYIKFCESRGVRRIPGRDRQWTIQGVTQYLIWRSKTNNIRSLKGIRSKIKHCALCYGFLLSTAPGEGPTELQKQVELVMNEISKRLKREAKRKGESTDPKRSLALGRVAVGMLFSAFGASSYEKFEKLESETRH